MPEKSRCRWFRCCYRFKSWRHGIGWPDGYARSHWMDDRGFGAVVMPRGSEAFIEEMPQVAARPSPLAPVGVIKGRNDVGVASPPSRAIVPHGCNPPERV